MRKHDDLKVFLNWSGGLSKEIAAVLKKWLPYIIYDIDVFYSPIDFAKREDWLDRLEQKMTKSRVSIICLTQENLNTKWILQEMMIVEKNPKVRIVPLLIGVEPSEMGIILSSYQTACLERKSLFLLVSSMNKLQTRPMSELYLKDLFDNVWEDFEKEINGVCKKYQVNNFSNEKLLENEALASEDMEESFKQLVYYWCSEAKQYESLLEVELSINKVYQALFCSDPMEILKMYQQGLKNIK